MLTDNFGRHFEYLRLSITDVCNFSCNYCLPDGYDCQQERDFLTLAELEVLVNAFAQLGVKKIRLTGGEPGLRKDLRDIIALCNEVEGIKTVALTTNGFNLKDHATEWAKAGLSALNVSADSIDPRLFSAITGHNKLEKILEGIALAEQAGIKKIKLNAVLLKQFNAHQLDNYLSWVATRNVTIRFIELMRTGDNHAFFAQNHVTGESVKAQLLASGWQQQEKALWAGPAQEFSHPDSLGRVGLIMPYSKDFCQQCNRLRVSARGKLHLCLFAEAGQDIRSWLRSGDIAGTKEAIVAALQDKVATHYLQDGVVGATQHLAMLGG
ncbi:GTP 3',8-cyclase MoaA [Pseudoalteromonas sp. S4741]|uniref:GTP 3',8-cyclase MoaA n=1 Tax=Pseudoalteromonas sp. S4741 TaxID=579563 RepID=UPI00110A9A36|nr:GTP 3',8-cyclase MoaA [Pseudoalteromonas sp. S4741]TMO28205.1 GTP 3',8-cyclase MoaA [Pseudoalteromonas sp. S4741]